MGCCDGQEGCTGRKDAAPAPAPPPVLSGTGIRTRLRILEMDCPTEEAMIRKQLGSMAAVEHLEFNLLGRILTVIHAPGSLDSILEAVRALGFHPRPEEDAAPPGAERAKAWWPLVLSAIAALGSEAAGWAGLPPWTAAVLGILAVAIGGLPTYRKGWTALYHGNLNINALMSLAVTGAMALGQWPEAAMVMVLFAVAERLEARSLDRARRAIQGLLRLIPDTATLRQADGSWRDVPAAAVPVGSVVRIKPGERIALDGEVLGGRSAVDQAPITGESLPVDKAEGDPVFAGTINGSGALECRVTAVASDSTLAHIIHAVEDAQGAKAPTQRFVDRFAKTYTPAVFALAVAVAVLPPLLAGGAWSAWIYRALVLLVIACPCALVISTPVTIVSGLAAAARRGILIKGGVHLEEGRKLAWLALDKTGTLTHGKPVQTDFEPWGDADPGQSRRLAAGLAARSDHPVSEAVARAAEEADVVPFAVEAFEALPGRGVRGLVDGDAHFLGNHRLVEELGRCSPELEARLDALERQGKTAVVLGDARRILAVFAVADTVREHSREAVADLHRLGIRTMMLTGDNPHTAQAIGEQVGIDRIQGNLLPADKLALIEGLAAEGPVGMAGDGINDAPALARADIGFSMGAMGTDVAIEAADVALMDDDLRKVPAFVRLSQATHAVLVQNIALALGIKAVFLALTLAGRGTMWMAVFADMGTSLLVVGNGLRLLRK
ncbi:cation-translocating P-type ATPase [Geothrix sp. 21YS21S-4]|uniref:heavy metal translocating P-type ATPase n=1 Tax=Geothrix sp. 21YS21S-4 TaxID=3068889 RepID=UPI0027BAC4AF|nr:heavy metal translocating P-type ATPase [Geothrix sp. 21YS21S-4]